MSKGANPRATIVVNGQTFRAKPLSNKMNGTLWLE